MTLFPFCHGNMQIHPFPNCFQILLERSSMIMGLIDRIRPTIHGSQARWVDLSYARPLIGWNMNFMSRPSKVKAFMMVGGVFCNEWLVVGEWGYVCVSWGLSVFKKCEWCRLINWVCLCQNIVVQKWECLRWTYCRTVLRTLGSTWALACTQTQF